jgi:hypothetical protein
MEKAPSALAAARGAAPRAVSTSRALLAAALVAAATTGCETPYRPKDGVQYDPPPVYRQWWSSVEQCSGLRGDFSRVLWYEVPSAPGMWGFACPNEPPGLYCTGEWHSPHTIMVAGPNQIYPGGHRYDSLMVKHEMLHDLTQSGDHGPLFARCVP